MVHVSTSLVRASASLSAAIVLASVGSQAAWAQVRELDHKRNVSVLNRQRPDFDALGVRAGSLLVFPKSTLSATYDDNIFAKSNGKTSDMIVSLQPQLTVRSDWSRNMIELFAMANVRKFRENPGENTNDFQIRADGRYDLSGDDFIKLSSGYSRLSEARTSTNTSRNTTRPVRYSVSEAQATGTKTFNRLRLVGNATVSEYRYENVRSPSGSSIDEKSRDLTETTQTARLEYEASPDTFLFVSGELQQINYRTQAQPGLLKRDAREYILSTGVRFDSTALLDGEIQIGYLNRDFKAPNIPSVDGLFVHGLVEVYPTQLTTLIFSADRAVGAPSDPRASSYLTTNGAIGLDHELSRNVIFSTRATYARDEYNGIIRTDRTWSARSGATYLVNRYLGIGLFYVYSKVQSSGADKISNYTDNQLTISAVLQR